MIFVNPLNCCTFAKRVVWQANLCIAQKLELLPNHYLYWGEKLINSSFKAIRQILAWFLIKIPCWLSYHLCPHFASSNNTRVLIPIYWRLRLKLALNFFRTFLKRIASSPYKVGMALIAVAIIIYFIIPTAKLQLLSEITKIFGEYFQENNEATLIAAFNAEIQNTKVLKIKDFQNTFGDL